MRCACVVAMLILLPAVILSGCSSEFHYDAFDADTEGILDVVTITAYGKDEAQKYYTLASGQRIKEAAAFHPDAMEKYTVPGDCFDSYIDRDKNKVLNRLVKTELLDSDGHSVEMTEDIKAIFQCLEGLEHELFNVEIFQLNEHLFVYVELNVNLWMPCTLYFFDQNANALAEMYTWDNERVIGLHIRMH